MRIIVVGGGASGCVASITAAELGAEVILLERNEKIGKKLYITGKGRCNFTNSCGKDEFFSNVVRNPKFLFGAYSQLDNIGVISFFKSCGLEAKEERGGRIFPVGDKSSDVIKCLKQRIENCGIKVKYNERVTDLIVRDGAVKGVKTQDRIYFADKVIVATGGVSYPSTGSTGDGHAFAKAVGHSVSLLKPALSAIETDGEFCRGLSGLSLKNVELTVYKEGKRIVSEFGEMLFMHNGISGPIALTVSSYVNREEDFSKLSFSLDLKPALTPEKLDDRILRDFSENMNKQLKNALFELLPRAMVLPVIQSSGVDPEKPINQVSAEERQRLVAALKGFPIKPVSLLDISFAIVTSGGINVNEISPKTMESKMMKGLYFCGEILDVDALTGGFNLQIAFSTGYVAGKCAAAE